MKTCRHCGISFQRPDIVPIPHDRCQRCDEEIKALKPSPTLREWIEKGQPVNTGRKDDNDKPMMDLIPPKAELALAQVLTFGAQKYGAWNWSQVDDLERRYLAAAMRHINAYRAGEVMDQESGLPHLAHAMCCLAFLIEKSA